MRCERAGARETAAESFRSAVERLPGGLRRAVVACLVPENGGSVPAEAPLVGLPCCVKDNFDVAGAPTQASSLFLEEVRPGPHRDGPLVGRLRALGLSVVAKTQMNEFAYGLDGANPHFGDVPHPRRPDRAAGGSSGGSAWTVAAGLVRFALGTDTGGSIRVPASYCGIFGLRLPPNRWAREGCFPVADPVRRPLRVRSLGRLPEPLEGAALRLFGDGAVAEPVPPGWSPSDVASAFTVLQGAEAFRVHRPWLEEFADRYDPVVLARIRRGASWTEADRSDAARIAAEVRDRFAALFARYDVLLLPAVDGPAPRRPVPAETRERLLRLNAPASLAGLPVLTFPASGGEKGSRGLQCILPPDRWRAVLEGVFDSAEEGRG